jgi:hypothetical protein
MNVKCFVVEKFFTETGEAVPVGRYITVKDKVAWRRVDTKEVLEVENDLRLPVGAMYRSWWYEETQWKGTDGESWTVQTPGGPWCIDSRASNCTRPDDSAHNCWCRHGKAPNFTVNKVGNTCGAGAGSIAMDGYHGFLINGELTDC